MSTADGHIEEIRKQFTKQGELYRNLPYVRDEAGHARVVATARVRPTDKVLDVASGPGYLTMAFASACAEATGIDATETFVDAARAEAAARAIQNVTFRQGDAERLDISDGAFDVAVCRAAFHHFPRPDRVLAEMKRVVRDRGKIVILDMVAPDDAEKARYQDRIEKLCDPTHVHCLSEREFHTLFEEAGLTLVHTGRGETCYSFDAWIAHGGPPPERVTEIRGLMEASIDRDLAGFRVWRESGELHFCHPGCAFVLEKRT